MRKLPLLILAVICVDIGFVAYMSADRQAEIASEEFNKFSRRIIPARASKYELAGTVASKIDDSSVSVASVAADAAANPSRSLAAAPRVDRQFRSSVGSRGYTSRRTTAAVRRIPAFPARRDLPMGNDTYALQKPADITIWYPGPRKPVEKKLPEPRPTRALPTKSENRSLVARLFVPIFKKPFGWIKALGSKLN
jgi:hypothetical protein